MRREVSSQESDIRIASPSRDREGAVIPEVPPVSASLSIIEARLTSGALVGEAGGSPSRGGPTGRKWRVRIFQYGLSKNRYPCPGLSPQAREGNSRLGAFAQTQSAQPSATLPLKWTPRSAREALRHLEGARCFADHTPDPAPGGGSGRSVRDLIGFYSEAGMGERGPEATLTLLESEGWARAKLLAAWQAGRPELIGFSVDAVIGVRPVGEGRARALEVESIAALHSVDMVSAASSGGCAVEVLEGEKWQVIRPREGDIERIHRKGETMREEIQRMLETLRRAGGGNAGGSPLRQLQQLLEEELAKPEVDAARVVAALADWLSSPETALSPAVSQVQEQVQLLRQQISEAGRRQRLAESRLLLESKLADSRLPKPLANLVASRFPSESPYGERPVSEPELDAEIQRVREAYAAVSPAGRVFETGRVRVLREPADKMQIALDRLLGLPGEDSSIPAFRGIREAYLAYTGDEEVSGTVSSSLRIREEFSTAGFPDALGNTLRRLLLKDYHEQDFGIGWIAQFSSVPDFRAQERIRVGYFGDLPAVDPEAADYDELAAPTDEKASYSVVTFGGLVTVTRKMIINDDLGVVPKIVGRLGRAARRTLAQRVFNLMINNPTIYDGLDWFHTTHGNLGSTALSAAELDVVRTAMRNLTEKDSGKKLGIGPHVLVVPNELEGLARQENERQYTDANFTPNRARFLFGPSSERVIVSPLLSDANDWYVFANKEEAPTVEVGFLQGRQEPEFFLADNPSAGLVFTSDRIRYKVRHEHEAVVIDFRGAYKEVVT